MMLALTNLDVDTSNWFRISDMIHSNFHSIFGPYGRGIFFVVTIVQWHSVIV
jgi:hypothetical protein